MPATYRKTAKGLAEISTRANKLNPRLRAALILVDGRRTDSELATMLPLEPQETLRWLTDSGFIEMAQSSANTSQWDTATADAAMMQKSPHANRGEPPPSSRKAIAQIQRESVRELTDQIGPMAEQIAMRIEKARSREELKPLLDLAVQLLSNMRGAKAAELFQAKYVDGV